MGFGCMRPGYRLRIIDSRGKPHRIITNNFVPATALSNLDRFISIFFAEAGRSLRFIAPP
jgi:hypothetical protein